MALTNPTLPSILPAWAVPYDSATAFSKAQTSTANGYVGNVNTQLNIGSGRFDGLWVVDISAAYMTSSNEFYQLWLAGSNDATFTAGNVEFLAMHDWAATAALRLLPAIGSASPVTPLTGLGALRHVIPFSNFLGCYIFQYLQLYLVVGGTTPSLTFSSWISYDTKDR